MSVWFYGFAFLHGVIWFLRLVFHGFWFLHFCARARMCSLVPVLSGSKSSLDGWWRRMGLVLKDMGVNIASHV